MSELPLTVADLVVLGVIGLSGFLAYFRGAVREVLFLATWGGALLAAVHLYDATYPSVSGWVGGDPLIAAAANATGLFVLALTMLTLVSSLIVKAVGTSKLNVLDRSLGFVFGLVRGAVVVCLVYLVYALIAPVEEHPRWLREARLTPLVASGTGVLADLVPETWGLEGARIARRARGASSAIEALDAYEELVNPRPEADGSGNPPDGEYNARDRSSLDAIVGSQE